MIDRPDLGSSSLIPKNVVEAPSLHASGSPGPSSIGTLLWAWSGIALFCVVGVMQSGLAIGLDLWGSTMPFDLSRSINEAQMATGFLLTSLWLLVVMRQPRMRIAMWLLVATWVLLFCLTARVVTARLDFGPIPTSAKAYLTLTAIDQSLITGSLLLAFFYWRQLMIRLHLLSQVSRHWTSVTSWCFMSWIAVRSITAMASFAVLDEAAASRTFRIVSFLSIVPEPCKAVALVAILRACYLVVQRLRWLMSHRCLECGYTSDDFSGLGCPECGAHRVRLLQN